MVPCWKALLVWYCAFSGISLVESSGPLQDAEGQYVVGTGIYDVTGPAAQINFMGYAKTSQMAHGIHTRLRARAFIISELPTQNEDSVHTDETLATKVTLQQERLRRKNGSSFQHRTLDTFKLSPNNTICFVSVDIGMGSDLVTLRVLKRLQELMPVVGGDGRRLCHLDNLSISGTHTHSAPAGFLQYTLYQITSAGFSSEVTDTYVEGIAQAILRAYSNLDRGELNMSKGKLLDANINRSPSSYLLNPESERDEYKADGDTDKTMLQLQLTHNTGHGKSQPIGLINWFPVHGTSMNASNLLISGDNKGYASYLMEKQLNNNSLPGQGAFVAAYASTNLGDVSPNTAGPTCIDTGEPCDLKTSTCNGNTNLCIAFGPGRDMRESTEIIGRKQYDKSRELLEGSQSEALRGGVEFRHSFVNMADLTVTLQNGTQVKTCPAALGYSFAGGTTDGPGQFPFHQAANTSNPFWNMVAGFLSIPDAEQIACHAPKPILLNTGKVKLPYDWDPQSVPISIFRVGQLFILNVPAEFTTMAGRRLRNAVGSILQDRGIKDSEITIAGLANSYTHYVTTYEEYAGQRYEAASTLYGPHTLASYIQEFERLTRDMLDGKPSTSDGTPKDLGKQQISMLPPVSLDTIGLGRKFGSVAVEPKDMYVKGLDTVLVSFRSANPRSNQRIEDTFLTVDLLIDNGSWETRYVDGDWSTRFVWNGGEASSYGVSFAEIFWEIPHDTPQGIYRICHHGTRQTFIGNVEWMLMYAPGWWILDAFGSMAIGISIQAIRLADSFSAPLSRALRRLSFSTTRDFSGCSKGFLVRAGGS